MLKKKLPKGVKRMRPIESKVDPMTYAVEYAKDKYDINTVVGANRYDGFLSGFREALAFMKNHRRS